MNEAPVIELEWILAALIKQNDGEVFVGKEFLEDSNEGLVMAITYDHLRDGMLLELVKESEVEYDDGSTDV